MLLKSFKHNPGGKALAGRGKKFVYPGATHPPYTNFLSQRLYFLRQCGSIRPLRKLASGSGVRGTYGAEDRSVFNIHEFSGTGETKQSAATVEFPARSIVEIYSKGIYLNP